MPHVRHLGAALALATLLAAPPDAAAQATPAPAPAPRPAPAATETRVIYFRLGAVVSGAEAGDSMVVVMTSGENEGVVPGGKGEVRATWARQDSLRPDILGSAEVTRVAPRGSVVTLRVADPRWRPRVGDMIAVPARVPRRARRTILWDLVERGIVFLDAGRQPLVSRATIFAADGDSLLAAVLAQAARDVRETLATIGPDVATAFPALVAPIAAGRNRGSTAQRAMAGCTPADIEAFLRFVRAFPGKYMGQEWKVNETWATWVLNNAPAGHDELRDTVLATRGEAELAAMLARYRRDFTPTADVITHWNAEAEQWAQQGRAAEAERLNALAQRVAQLLGNPGDEAWALFSLGIIKDAQGKYAEALATYDRAAPLFERVPDARGLAFTENNRGRELNNLSRYEEALAAWRRAVALKSALTPTQAAGLADVNESIASSLAGLAFSFEKLARYDSAEAAYDRALAVNARAASASAQKTRALMYKNLARVAGRRGDGERALQRLDSALALYRALADRSGEADVIAEVGFQLARQSRYADAIGRYEEAFALYVALGATRAAGFTRSRIGQTWWSLGNFAKAIEAHRAALALRDSAGDRAGVAYSQSKLGALHRESGDPASAIEAYGRAAATYRDIGDRASEAEVTNELGALYAAQEDWTHALEEYGRALAAREAIGARGDVAETLFDLGDVHQQMKSWELAERSFQRSHDLRQAIGDKEGDARSLARLGLLRSVAHGDQAQAERYLREALRLAAAAKNATLEAWTRSVLSDVQLARGQVADARAEAERALALYRSAGARSGEATQLMDLGALHVSGGAFDSAMTAYREALAVATGSNSRQQVARAHLALAELYRQLGRFDEAMAEANQSLAESRALANPWGIAGASMALGSVHNARGDYRAATALYTRADSIYLARGGALSRLGPINDRGTIFFYQGDYDQALVQFREALALLEAAHDSSENRAIVLGNIGEALYEQRKLDEAGPWLDRALALDAAIGAWRNAAAVLTIRGKLHLDREAFDLARRDLDSAYAMSARSGAREPHLEAAGVLGKLHVRQQRYPDAVRLLDEAITGAKAIGADKLAWEPLYTRALLARATGDTTRAIALLEEAAGALERLRGRLVGGEAAARTFASGDAKARVYDALVALLVPRDPERALAVVERSANDELRRRFGGAQLAYADSGRRRALATAREKQAQAEALRGQIAATYRGADTVSTAAQRSSLRKSLVIAETDYRGFVEQVVRTQPGLKNHIADAARSMRGAKARLPADAAILAYLPGNEALYIFAATRDTVVAASVPIGREELERRVMALVRAARRAPAGGERARRGVGDDDAPAGADVHALAAGLDSLLVQPLAQPLAGKQRLAIMPSGVLFYLPFEVLGQPVNGRFRFLAEDRTIFYVNNSERITAGAKAMGRPRIMAFGNADSTLASAEREVAAIKRQYPDAQVYVRREATKARAAAVPASFNVVHFATHGMLDTAFATSYLTLARGGPADDGRLTANEIFQLPGRGRAMVVLSACNTAVTDQSVTDWPNSLALAFMDIGVQTVVASLWPVDDEATAILMNAFYREIPKVGRAEALRRARNELLKVPRYRHPYYWGAFVLLGDWN